MNKNRKLVSDLLFNEKINLKVALTNYLRCMATQEGVVGQANNYIYKITKTSDLVNEFAGIFIKNPSVMEKLKNGSLDKLSFNESDLRKILSFENNSHDSQGYCSKIKGRFLIFALEILGYYSRPTELSANAMFHLLNKEMFREQETDFTFGQKIEGNKDAKDICGLYSLKRLSFNSSFPNHVTASLLYIDKESYEYANGNRFLYRYKTFNQYLQESSGQKLSRERITDGYIYNYQSNLLFLGKVTYSHIEESDKVHDHYPEIFLCHQHAGDVKSIRGLILGHYPFLGLPVTTSLCLSKIDDLNHPCLVKKKASSYMKDLSEDEIKALKDMQYIGNFPFDSLKKPSDRDFLINTIETQYSQMLTP